MLHVHSFMTSDDFISSLISRKSLAFFFKCRNFQFRDAPSILANIPWERQENAIGTHTLVHNLSDNDTRKK